MSSLTPIDKKWLEKALQMGGGYVLNYTDASFGEFFERHSVDIHGPKYRTYGGSKARKLRSFWDQESDRLVGRAISEMLDEYEADCEINGWDVDAQSLKKARGILASRLETPQKTGQADTVQGFLREEFDIPNIQSLPVEPIVVPIIESRLLEAQKALSVEAYLSVVILCGSILEAVLLGSAQKEPVKFNKSTASPKTKAGKVKLFHDWTLSNLIAVATDVGVLKPDVQKFGHGLRDFRNYIHPYQQIVSGFAPDEHTAKVCLQALKAALASVAGERH